MATYTIEVQTGDHKHAGTDAKVYIQLIGARSTSPERRLDNADDNFERAKLDRFRLQMEDVGWVNSIRMFHDDAKKQPGWYLDWVRVTNEDLGLAFKADFYRWLARTEGDGLIDVTMPVPVNTVALARGSITSHFMGYNTIRKSNGSTVGLNLTETLAFQHKQGMSLKKANSWSVNTNAKIGAEFFGLKSEFTSGVTRSVISDLSTTEEQTITATSELQFTLAGGQSITAVALYYQSILEGEALANGARMQFQDRFLIDDDLIVFDGMLSDRDVEDRVTQLLQGALRATAARLPSPLPAREALIPLRTCEVAGPLRVATVNPVLATFPTRWFDQAQLDRVGARRFERAQTVGSAAVIWRLPHR